MKDRSRVDRLHVEEVAILTNRFTKAVKLADVLEQAGADADQVPILNLETWKVAAAQAGTSPPSVVTKALIAFIMVDRESRKVPQ